MLEVEFNQQSQKKSLSSNDLHFPNSIIWWLKLRSQNNSNVSGFICAVGDGTNLFLLNFPNCAVDGGTIKRSL